MKMPLLAASLVLVAGTATACGGGAPTDASQADFCDAITNIAETSAAVAGDGPSEDQIKEIKGAFSELEDVGTPEDMSDEAREGFELVTEAMADIDEDATAEELEKAGDDFSGEDDKSAEAFSEYVAENCDLSSMVPEMPEMPEMPELPEGTPSE